MGPLLELVGEVDDFMTKHPDSDIEFTLYGAYESDESGGISVRAAAGAPAVLTGSVDAQLSTGYSRARVGQRDYGWRLRVFRPGTGSRSPFQELGTTDVPEN